MSKVENQGLKVYNDNNQLCIDSNYSNLELKRVVKFGDLPLLSRNEYAVFRTLTLQDGELLVAREINSVPIKNGTNNDGSAHYSAVNIYNASCADEIGTYRYALSFKFYQDKLFKIDNPESYANELKLYVFGPMDQLSKYGSGEGLKVYDKNGRLVYDSTKKYMRVVDMAPTSVFHAPYDLTNKKYAVVESAMNLPNYTRPGNFCDFYSRVDQIYPESNKVSLLSSSAFFPGLAFQIYTLVPLLSGCFILDVTNY